MSSRPLALTWPSSSYGGHLGSEPMIGGYLCLCFPRNSKNKEHLLTTIRVEMTLEALAAETTQLVTSVLTAGSSGIIVATPALAPGRQTGVLVKFECISPAFAWAATAQRSGSKSSSSSWHLKASMSPSPQWPSVHSSAACCRMFSAHLVATPCSQPQFRVHSRAPPGCRH